MRPMRALRRLYVDSGLQRAIPHGVKTSLRAAWLPAARTIGYPVSSPRVPRPQLSRTRTPMRIGRVLTACDLNADYLDFWPNARRAWLELVGVEPLLVLVADEVPDHFADDELVVTFTPVEGLHSAFQAQCIRLLYPALVDTGDAVLISDVDLYPLRPSYFLDPVQRLDRSFFVSYRDVRFERGEVSMSFNAATPSTWSELFAVASEADVRARLVEWGGGLHYDGRRGWDGWYTDQQVLYRTLTGWPEAPRRWWVLDDAYTRYRQPDRLELEREQGLEPHRRDDIRARRYSEFNCLLPYGENQEVNDLVLELALQSGR
jgi:hypothetical protein